MRREPGRAAEALTLWAACAAIDQHQGHTLPPWSMPRWENSVEWLAGESQRGECRQCDDPLPSVQLARVGYGAVLLIIRWSCVRARPPYFPKR